MYEIGRSGWTTRQQLRQGLRRLEATLLRHQEQQREAQRLQDAPGMELLARTARLLMEEVERLRSLLA